MSVKFVDALLGYEFYLQNRGKPTLEEVNEYLATQRRPPIALRTYEHYGKLVSYGFRSYVPINKFDVFRSLGRIQMAADRRRFSRQVSSISAEVSNGRQKWASCEIVDFSLVGFGIKTEKRFPTKPGNLVWIRRDGYEIIPCFVAWRKHIEDNTRIGLRAQEFIDNYRIASIDHDRHRLLGRYIISRQDEGEIDWEYLVNYLEKSDELLVAIRDLIVAVSESANRSANIPRSVLDRIQFGSPGSAEIKIDLGIAEILKILLDFVQHFGLQRKRYRAEIEGIELDNQRKQLENSNLQIEIIRNAINFGREAQIQGSDPQSLREILGPSLLVASQLENLPELLFEEKSPEKAIVDERIIPALAELTNGDDPSFEITVETANDE